MEIMHFPASGDCVDVGIKVAPAHGSHFPGARVVTLVLCTLNSFECVYVTTPAPESRTTQGSIATTVSQTKREREVSRKELGVGGGGGGGRQNKFEIKNVAGTKMTAVVWFRLFCLPR